jgi:hypothetical protein
VGDKPESSHADSFSHHKWWRKGGRGVGEQKGKLGEEMFLALMVGAGMGEATRVF